MASAEKRTVRIIRHKYVLRTPTNAVEVGKAIDWVYRDLPEDKAKWDNAVTIDSTDEEIVIYWEVEEVPKPTQKAKPDLSSVDGLGSPRD